MRTTTVIAITDRNDNFGLNDLVEHRGVYYAIRIDIRREEWRVAIYPPGNELAKERTILGTYEDAEITPRSMINAWLKKAIRADTAKR